MRRGDLARAAKTRTAEEVEEMLQAVRAALHVWKLVGNGRPSAVIHGRRLAGSPMTSLQSCPRR